MDYTLSVVMRSIIALTVPRKTSTRHLIQETETGMADQNGTLHLNDDDIAFLHTLLRNATSPLTTQQMIDALRQRSGR